MPARLKCGFESVFFQSQGPIKIPSYLGSGPTEVTRALDPHGLSADLRSVYEIFDPGLQEEQQIRDAALFITILSWTKASGQEDSFMFDVAYRVCQELSESASRMVQECVQALLSGFFDCMNVLKNTRRGSFSAN